MKLAGDRHYVGNTRVALAVIGGWIVVAKVSKVTNDSLVEVGDLLVDKGVSIESGWIGTALEEGPDLMVLETVIVVRVVKTTRRRRRDSGYSREGISRWRVVPTVIGSRVVFIDTTRGIWMVIDGNRSRTGAGSRKISPSRRARRNGPVNAYSMGAQSLSSTEKA